MIELCEEEKMRAIVESVCTTGGKYLIERIFEYIYDREDTDAVDDLMCISNVLTSTLASILYANGLYRRMLDDNEEESLKLIDQIALVVKKSLAEKNKERKSLTVH